MSAEDKSRSFGELVLRELQGRCPKAGGQPKVFLMWLEQIYMETLILKMS